MQPHPPQQPPGGPLHGLSQPPYGPVPGYRPLPPKRRAPMVVATVSIAVVLGVLVFVFIRNLNDHSPGLGARASAATAGDCLKVNSASTTDADVEKIDCAAPAAVYKVGTKLDGTDRDCPSDSYDRYTQTGLGDGFTLCLMLNAAEGDCFANVAGSGGSVAKVACSAADVQLRAGKVVDGQASESVCPADTALALVYPQPGETICLSEVTGA